jgi:hypothetical protein
MPPQNGSRHAQTVAQKDEDDRLHLTDRQPLTYRDLPDNRRHVVVEGDTWWGLADRYFQPLPRACGYFWALCDFQPEPVLDPTRTLEIGRVVVIPSLHTLTAWVLADTGGAP